MTLPGIPSGHPGFLIFTELKTLYAASDVVENNAGVNLRKKQKKGPSLSSGNSPLTVEMHHEAR